MAENQYWILMMGTVLKTGTILSWESLHGLRNTSRNRCLCTQFTVPSTKRVKAPSYKAEAICEHDPEIPSSSLGQSSFKMD